MARLPLALDIRDRWKKTALKGLRPEKKPGVIRRSQLSERGPSDDSH